MAVGDLSDDGGGTFFVRRLLSYRPDQRQRQFRAPFRRIDFYSGYAIYRAGKPTCFCPSGRLGSDLELVETFGGYQNRHGRHLRSVRQASMDRGEVASRALGDGLAKSRFHHGATEYNTNTE